MTERLYYEDNKMKDFDATVISCEWDEKKNAYGVILDKTAFFPEGGGQYADPGTLASLTVTDVKESGDDIIHYVSESLKTGDLVHGEIDFKERYSRMQQHSGEHIVSGIVHARKGYDNVGFHLGEFITTLDFNGPLTADEIQSVELAANEAVYADLPILVSYPSKEELNVLTYRSKKELEGQVRIVTIPGIDVCACCAPHVTTTGEIGIIKIVDSVRYKGGTRLSMLAGSRALTDYNQKEDSVKEISRLLSAKPEEITEAVTHLQDENQKLKEKIVAMQTQAFSQKLSDITADTKDYILFQDEADKNAARRFVDGGMRKLNGICGIFLGTDDTGYQYILGSINENLRDFLKEFHESCPGKGGGKPEMVQGSTQASKACIEEYFASR